MLQISATTKGLSIYASKAHILQAVRFEEFIHAGSSKKCADSGQGRDSQVQVLKSASDLIVVCPLL